MFKAQSSKSSGSSSYHESGSHNPFLYIIFRDGAFHLSDKDICRFLAYCHTSLFHSGKHRITRLGTVTIGKATDADIIRHTESHTLGGIEDADCRIIVDGKESIRNIRAISPKSIAPLTVKPSEPAFGSRHITRTAMVAPTKR